MKRSVITNTGFSTKVRERMGHPDSSLVRLTFDAKLAQ